MFLMTSKPTYKRPVTVYIPNEGGDFDATTFTVVFRLVTDIDELNDLRQKPEREVLAGEGAVLVGWDGLFSGDGAEVPFNEENRFALCAIPQALVEIAKVYWLSIWKDAEHDPAKN